MVLTPPLPGNLCRKIGLPTGDHEKSPGRVIKPPKDIQPASLSCSCLSSYFPIDTSGRSTIARMRR
jgi:hypothetical protein